MRRGGAGIVRAGERVQEGAGVGQGVEGQGVLAAAARARVVAGSAGDGVDERAQAVWRGG